MNNLPYLVTVAHVKIWDILDGNVSDVCRCEDLSDLFVKWQGHGLLLVSSDEYLPKAIREGRNYERHVDGWNMICGGSPLQLQTALHRASSEEESMPWRYAAVLVTPIAYLAGVIILFWLISVYHWLFRSAHLNYTHAMSWINKNIHSFVWW